MDYNDTSTRRSARGYRQQKPAECAKVRGHLSYILLYLNIYLQVVRHYVILGTRPPPVRILIAKTPQSQMYQTLQDGSTITGPVSEHTSVQSTPLQYSSIRRVHDRSTYPVMLPFTYYPVSRYRRSVGKNAPRCLHCARRGMGFIERRSTT